MKTKKLEELEGQLHSTIEAKDKFVRDSRETAAKLTAQIEALRAEASVEMKVAEMSEAEKVALRKALGDN